MCCNTQQSAVCHTYTALVYMIYVRACLCKSAIEATNACLSGADCIDPENIIAAIHSV